MKVLDHTTTSSLQELAQSLDGDCYHDDLLRAIYATDASVYREWPLAVTLPKHAEDIRKILAFAKMQGTSVIPRTAGTSLAGQCVGEGIILDVSKYMNRILEFNAEEQWVVVEPGVVRDELNAFLKPHGLFFGPNTSTANRCMIGGMVGNNSCGTTSIVYGSTRDHVLELDVLLSDGSQIAVHPLSVEAFRQKCQQSDLEGHIYRQLDEALSNEEQQTAIREAYPKATIHRRNTGYAVDLLLQSAPFSSSDQPFDLSQLLCGSEGTLAVTTSIKLNLVPLPPPEDVVVCAHFENIRECMEAVLIAMEHQPSLCELMDRVILNCTKDNIEQQKNRFFVEGDPAGILMVEFRGNTPEEAAQKADQLIAAYRKKGMGYAFPKVFAPESSRVWTLRKASLGLLANIPGDDKAVACIEDTAVDLQDLPDYIDEIAAMMGTFGQEAVYYAHAGAGEIHLRPILDLKKQHDQELFYQISEATAKIVKKYKGSLSGEHGDGRVRAAFIPMMIGEKNYELLRQIKQTWDPHGLLNPGKIVDAPPMNTSLRYAPDQVTKKIDTVFDFSATQGILRAAEKCNGSGDCRKLSFAGGTMCPSYRATRDEKDTTRARANVLREFLTMSTKANPFDHPEIKTAMDLCLSCKGCTAECPSNVDMTTLKAEFQYHYQKANGIPLRARAFAAIGQLNGLGSNFPKLTNFFLSNRFTSGLLKRFLRVAPQRQLPLLHTISLRKWYQRNLAKASQDHFPNGKVWFFCDEFTNYNDAAIGIKAIQLLQRLGYQVQLIAHAESGRAHLSKGLLDQARQFATQNVQTFADKATQTMPLIGLEPSAILSFRDEYPKLVPPDLREKATQLASSTFLIEEFLCREAKAGRITPAQFSDTPKHILLHGHCHQKALSELSDAAYLLSLPAKYTVEIIPSGCCGMAGSFGYEQEHYEVSMKIGEEVLFPAVRKATTTTVIAAAGTSCRHQIADGTGRQALHPVEVLWESLTKM
ncbi:MAG: FAD-linked oxidase C-terminal domain-containing protein [Bacteroidota bacterium]